MFLLLLLLLDMNELEKRTNFIIVFELKIRIIRYLRKSVKRRDEV